MYTTAVTEERDPVTVANTWQFDQSGVLDKDRDQPASTHPFPVAVLVLSVRTMEVLCIQSNHRNAEDHLEEEEKCVQKMPGVALVEDLGHDGQRIR